MKQEYRQVEDDENICLGEHDTLHQGGLLLTAGTVKAPEAVAHPNGIVTQTAPRAVHALTTTVPTHDIIPTGALHLGTVCPPVPVVALAPILLRALVAGVVSV